MMKICNILLLAFVVLLSTIIFGACGEDDNGPVGDYSYMIQVSGDGLQPFTGSYSVVTTEGEVVTTNVQGYAPDSYRVKGVQVDCRFQKLEKPGLLRVVILKQGKVVGQAETEHAYGTISITVR